MINSWIDRCTDFFENFFEQEKHHLLNFVPVGIGLGIIFYFSLLEEPNIYVNFAIFFVLLAAVIFVKFPTKLFCGILFTISFGFLISQLRTLSVNTYMLAEPFDHAAYFSATVNTCEKTYNGMRFIVDDVECRKDNQLERLQLSWRSQKAMQNEIDYVPGARVLFCAILSPIYDRMFPEAYDYRKQQFFRGVSARGFIVKPPKILKEPKHTDFRILIEQLRHKINKKIENCLSDSTAAIAKALITGNTAGISNDLRANFSNSGIAHILAISGLHIGIIGFFIFWIFRILFCCFPKIAMYYDSKKIAAIFSWLIVLIYLYISGRSIPSIRAFFMHSLIMIAILLNRTAITMRSVAIAATIIITFSPESILFPSFQMSFSAVIALVAFFENREAPKNFLGKFRDTIITTLIASAATTLFSINSFNQLTLNSLLANLVAVPLMSFFVMPLAVISLFSMPFGLDQQIIPAFGYGVDLLIQIAKNISQLPGSFFVMPTPAPEVMAIFVSAGLLITLVHHWIRNLGWIFLVVGLICYQQQPLPDLLIAPHGKTVGVRIGDTVCFSSRRYFRSLCNMWTKSVGCQSAENFHSDACSKFLKKIAPNTYLVELKGKKIIITKDESEIEDEEILRKIQEKLYRIDLKEESTENKTEINGETFRIIRINKEENEKAEQILLPSGQRKKIEQTNRPWIKLKS